MKKKLEYWLWGIGLLFIFLICWQFIRGFYQQQVIAQQVDRLEEKTQLFLSLSEGHSADFQAFADDYSKDATVRLTLLDTDGQVIFDTSDPTLAGKRHDRPEVQAVLQGSTIGKALRNSATLHQELLYVSTPIKKAGKLTGILRIAEPTAPFLAKSHPIQRAILFVYCLFCLFVFCLIFYSLRQKNRPVQTILPVLKKMLASPQQQAIIMKDTPQHHDLYQTINQLSEVMSQTSLAYAASAQQLDALLSELMIGVFVIDATQQIRLMNPTMKEQLQINTSLKLPQLFSEVFLDPQLIQLIYQVQQQQSPIHEILTLNEEEPRILDLNLRLFNDNQEIIGISYDLTRIRQLEKIQKDFVSNVSHELKTPVTSLIGFTETLLDGAKDDPVILKEFLTIMQKDAYRLQVLIQEIIQLSKGQEALDYLPQEVHIDSFLKKIVADYQSILTQKTIQVQMTGPKDGYLLTKVELLQPILKNLIENAVTYSRSNTLITLHYQIGSEFQFTITDQGIGIDSDDQQRIFERFYRVDKARTRDSGGTGLGLAIVKDYTQLLGGTIQVESHPGVGTTFRLSLPVSENK